MPQVTARQAGTVQGLAVGAGAQVSDGQVLLNVVEGDEDQHQEEQKQQ
jgi:biotin carboxyl carrier protein